MKKRPAVLGVVCGLLCALAVFAYTQSVQGEAQAARAEALTRFGGEQVDVCVAARNLVAGDTVSRDAVTVKSWVSDLLPEGAIRSVDEVVGKQLTSSILAGEVVAAPRFEKVSSDIEIPEGTSALSVPAKDVQCVGGVLSSGSRVDVYATGGSATNLILQNVLVLSTSAEQAKEKTAASLSWVTLAIQPSNVQEIIDVSQKSELYFVLPKAAEEGSL